MYYFSKNLETSKHAGAPCTSCACMCMQVQAGHQDVEVHAHMPSCMHCIEPCTVMHSLARCSLCEAVKASAHPGLAHNSLKKYLFLPQPPLITKHVLFGGCKDTMD